MEPSQVRRNRFGFGLGTIGRDMSYTLISMYLIFFFSDILDVSASVLGGITVVLVLVRIFDAVNDPFMGVLIDNTRSRWGRYKPWILSGCLASSVAMVLMFTDRTTGLPDGWFIAGFAVMYLLWEITFTANDIGFWSMMPALSQDQKERERIGAFARICANVGAFSMVVAIVPLTAWIADVTGSVSSSYFYLAIGLAVITVAFQLVMLVLVKEDHTIVTTQEKTPWRDLLGIIVRNDQLLVITLAQVMFSVAFGATTSFGIYYFKYVYGDEGMYAVFAAVLGVAQLSALAIYPWLSRFATRGRMFTVSMVMVVAGYLVFWFAPNGVLAPIVVAGLLVFAGQAFIQLLMLVFIADTVEYGQWKFGRRNASVTLSLQPFITKMGSAISSGIVGWTVIASGMKAAEDAADMTAQGVDLVKTAMLLVPMLLIVASWVVHRRFYTLDEERYAEIVAELGERDRTLVESEEPRA
ncbi:MAG: glycoside-pentoside-hexuronide (GPH):cation symporter [Nocardioides sp.]|uniref:glycoside-pentoside-hexuronide (GPH):cation symporter n=1 Tax=Nocardioides sp. TaxID=35761 RepID=UPI003F0F04EF